MVEYHRQLQCYIDEAMHLEKDVHFPVHKAKDVAKVYLTPQ